ncbi:hypothetical protein Pelo_9550 [Pelomyxa schiedti]|nr:hypothetical protein Pelo_9550 [Pelomyxa schiedti]
MMTRLLRYLWPTAEAAGAPHPADAPSSSTGTTTATTPTTPTLTSTPTAATAATTTTTTPSKPGWGAALLPSTNIGAAQVAAAARSLWAGAKARAGAARAAGVVPAHYAPCWLHCSGRRLHGNPDHSKPPQFVHWFILGYSNKWLLFAPTAGVQVKEKQLLVFS